MLSIRDGEALARALRSDTDLRTKALLRVRSDQLGGHMQEQAHFAVVQAADTLTDLEQTLGFSIFENPADGSRVGEPDFTPGWEWIEDHGFAWELCFILTDDGFAHVVIVPKDEAIDPHLRAFCAQFAPEHA